MHIKFNDKTPIYLQLINLIKMDIVTGKLKAMDNLPSVREMAIDFTVNPNTLQKAYEELERLKIIYMQKDMGILVREEKNIVDDLKKEMAKEAIDSFVLRMKSLGFTDNEVIKIATSRLGLVTLEADLEMHCRNTNLKLTQGGSI